MVRLIQHHVKYKEIHGEDKVVLMTYGEHRKLHNRLRKDGDCKIPSDVLEKISVSAYQRTVIGREKHRFYSKEYTRKSRKRILFRETVAPHIFLLEEIAYNLNTGTVYISSTFAPNNGRKLLIIHCSDDSTLGVSQEVLPEQSGSSSPLKG